MFSPLIRLYVLYYTVFKHLITQGASNHRDRNAPGCMQNGTQGFAMEDSGGGRGSRCADREAHKGGKRQTDQKAEKQGRRAGQMMLAHVQADR
jgi:hypothetical protein